MIIKTHPGLVFNFSHKINTCEIYYLCEMSVQTTVLPFKPQKHNLAF